MDFTEKYDKNNFVRILKELGIYRLWLTKRLMSSKFYLEENKKKHAFDFIDGNNGEFSDYIDKSLCWDETGCFHLWDSIWASEEGQCKLSDLAYSQEKLNGLREVVKKALIKIF